MRMRHHRDGVDVTAPLDLEITVQHQPDDTTCGPTCLHALYRYHGDDIGLDTVIAEVPTLPGGGTLAVYLANHALARHFRATLYTYNLTLFDPTWFASGAGPIAERLTAQREAKAAAKLSLASDGYLEFLARGGVLRLEDLTADLLRRYLVRGVPLLAGLSATYLYRCARERGGGYDDVGGAPAGHFVVLSGYDRTTRRVSVADPLHDNPGFGTARYWVPISHLTSAIMLGIVTYDANVLAIEPSVPGKRV